MSWLLSAVACLALLVFFVEVDAGMHRRPWAVGASGVLVGCLFGLAAWLHALERGWI